MRVAEITRMPVRIKTDLYTHIAVATAFLFMAAMPARAAPDTTDSPFPGLELVSSKNIDRLYRRPDVDMSAYTKVWIGEPIVEFSKNWSPRNYGTFGLSASQVKKIRDDLANLAKST